MKKFSMDVQLITGDWIYFKGLCRDGINNSQDLITYMGKRKIINFKVECLVISNIVRFKIREEE